MMSIILGNLLIIITAVVMIAAFAYLMWKYIRHASIQSKFVTIPGFIALIIGIVVLWDSPIAMVLFGSVVTLSILTGALVTDAKGIIGVFAIAVSLMAMTASYPDVMGTAVFGEWWPTVRARVDEVERALSPAMGGFTQTQDTLGRGWTCLASPMDCYDMFEAGGEVEKEYQALRLSRPDPIGLGRIGNVAEMDEDSTVFSSTFEIENKLSHDDYINPPVIRELTLKPKDVEFVGREDLDIAATGGNIVGPHCSDDVCDIESLNPGVIHQYQVEFPREIFDEDALEDMNPGDQLRYGIDARYVVDTSSLLEVEIIDSTRFMELSERGDLDFHQPLSRYEWGPVEIGMAASRQQPIRGGESMPLILTLRNQDDGWVESLNSISIGTSEEGWVGGLEDCDFSQKYEDNFDDLGWDGLQPKGDEHDSLTMSCTIEVDEPEDITETKDLRVDMSYEYRMETTDTIEVMYS